jgi:hypothetical protein
MTSVDELLGTIFDGRQPEFCSEFAGWVRGSRRFKAFAITYQTKIRAKLRNASDENRIKDVRVELETAALLLRDNRFTLLEYEKYTASKQRGPDFTVTFRTHTPFNVEVRRIRGSDLEVGDVEALTIKLMAVLCDKVGQMPAGIVNLLWLTAEADISSADLTRAQAKLRQQADSKIDDFFMRRGFESSADFLKHYRHLSGVVLRTADQNDVWINRLAKHKPPSEIVAAISRLEAK